MRFRRLTFRGIPRGHDAPEPDRAPSLRVRGWAVAFGVGLLVWAVIAGIAVLAVDLGR